MTECKVTCHQCRTDTDRPKRWRWLCETCAEECADFHRRHTGHQVDLTITREPADTLTALLYAQGLST